MGRTWDKGKHRYVVAITGASGVIYGKRLLEILNKKGYVIHFSLTEHAINIIEKELAVKLDINDVVTIKNFFAGNNPNFIYHRFLDFDVPIASGSYKTDGMVIVPCSMGTLGRIASGVSTNLIERAADVTLKERRKLIVVPRETPLDTIHLENMDRLATAGAIILPACPGFYNNPKDINDLVNFIVERILAHLLN
jgi:4-hydroxy-3-polyprenylbenzoate decarboxylase